MSAFFGIRPARSCFFPFAIFSNRKYTKKKQAGCTDMKYMSAVEAAALWGISARMINYYCVDGRIPGV
jgi:hypothetical protein